MNWLAVFVLCSGIAALTDDHLAEFTLASGGGSRHGLLGYEILLISFLSYATAFVTGLICGPVVIESRNPWKRIAAGFVIVCVLIGGTGVFSWIIDGYPLAFIDRGRWIFGGLLT